MDVAMRKNSRAITGVFLSLVFLVACTSHAWPQASSEGAVAISLGKDSPAAGKDSYVTLSLTSVEGAKVGKVSSEISFANNGQVAFDRAELTPDVRKLAKLEVDKSGLEGKDVAKLKLTVTGNGTLPDGILANVVFKVLKRPKGDKEPLQMKLDNKAAAWTTDNKEIAIVTGEAGEIDFEYAPVVFACFFYMH